MSIIGHWVKRDGRFFRRPDGTWAGPRWHRVESVIADRTVIRCGKEMHRVDARGRELEVRDTEPFTRMIGQPQICRAGCADDIGDGMLEDDASTQPVETVP